MTPSQCTRDSRRIRTRLACTLEVTLYFLSDARHGLGIQGIAAEEIDFLHIRKQTGTGGTARSAFHLLDRQEVIDFCLVRVELGPVEMAGNDQNVAMNLLAARRGEPVRATSLQQLDKLILLGGQVPAKRLFFVWRVDGDGADRTLARCCRRAPSADSESKE